MIQNEVVFKRRINEYRKYVIGKHLHRGDVMYVLPCYINDLIYREKSTVYCKTCGINRICNMFHSHKYLAGFGGSVLK